MICAKYKLKGNFLIKNACNVKRSDISNFSLISHVCARDNNYFLNGLHNIRNYSIDNISDWNHNCVMFFAKPNRDHSVYDICLTVT